MDGWSKGGSSPGWTPWTCQVPNASQASWCKKDSRLFLIQHFFVAHSYKSLVLNGCDISIFLQLVFFFYLFFSHAWLLVHSELQCFIQYFIKQISISNHWPHSILQLAICPIYLNELAFVQVCICNNVNNWLLIEF